MVKEGGKGTEKGSQDVRLRVVHKECFGTFQNQDDRSFQNGISIPVQTAGGITGSGMMTVRLTGYRWTEMIPLFSVME